MINNPAKTFISVTVLILVLFFITFYFLLLSPLTANFTDIINTRHSYINFVDTILIKLKIKNVDAYVFLRTPFRVMRTYENGYLYGLSGKVVGINPDINIMYFKCSNGKIYGFKVNANVPGDENNIVWLEGKVIKNNELISDNLPFVAIRGDPKRITVSDESLYSIMWKDDRKLTQILADYKKDESKPTNNTEDQIITFTKFE